MRFDGKQRVLTKGDAAMTKHIADHRAPSDGGRLRHFLRIARGEARIWHRSEAPAGNRRLIEFCRIARGLTA